MDTTSHSRRSALGGDGPSAQLIRPIRLLTTRRAADDEWRRREGVGNSTVLYYKYSLGYPSRLFSFLPGGPRGTFARLVALLTSSPPLAM